MRARQRFPLLLAAAGLASGCSGLPGDSENVGRISEAFSVCEESVPAEHIVDGIPAYGQCSASQSASTA